MPLIDLDHQAKATPGRAPRRRLRFLIPLTVGLLLVSVAGERPRDTLSPHDRATFCPLLAHTGRDASSSVTVVDGSTGKVVRVLHCPAQ